MALLDWIQESLLLAASRLRELATEPLSPDSRYFVGYMLLTLAIAAVIYIAEHGKNARSVKHFFKWAFPKSIYTHHSFKVDAGLIIFNQMFMPGVWIAEGLALGQIDDWIIAEGRAVFHGPLLPGEPALWITLSIGFLVFCVFDFAMYLHHTLGHKIPLLWEIHRVHHSAEHLTPLTADRFHPLEEMIKSLIVIPMVGLAIGLFGIIFEANIVSHGYQIVKIWLMVRLFSMVGANLRHMHIWWSWPDWIACIVSSPAQHQIHHSIDPKHYGKNMGAVLSIWDWLFGTLYQPREREQITFGVNEGQNHHSTAKTLWQPITGLWRVIRRQPAPPVAQ